MRFKLSVVAAAVSTTIVFLPAAALASCIGDVCVSGQDEGNMHYINFSLAPNGSIASPDHYNFNDGQGQRQLGLNETQVRMTIPPRRPVTLHYSFQVCNHAFAGSTCGPWANFQHVVQ